MPYVRKLVSGSVQVKSGMLYAVLNLYDADNQRHRRSINTGFHSRNGKTSAKEFLHRLLAMINDPNAIALSPKMIGIIDTCNKRYCGSFEPERYLNLLQEVINENKRISSMKEDMPFVDYLIFWLKSKRNLQPLTYEGYRQMITGRITEFFGARNSSLGNLSSEDFDEYYDYLRFQCGLTDCTALHHHRMIKQALSYGVKKGLLLYNVMDKVDAPGDSEFQGDYYRADEAKRLLEKAKADPLYIVIVLTVYYGFRRSEVLGLRWSAVDFQANIIHIERKVISLSQNGRTEYQDEAKMKSKASFRSLPLIPVVKEALLQEKARQELFREQFGESYCRNENGYICVDALGHLLTPDYVTRHFEILLKKNHLRRIRFHDLRHTCATLLVMNGISLLHISRWLGHSSIGITEKYYLHFDVSSQIETAKKMEETLSYQCQ